MKVLLVEDDIINQELAIEMMEDFDCDLSIANDGFEAIEYCKKGQFNLILMDIQMPGMDGIQTTKMIRELEVEMKWVPTPIYALSANDTDGIEGQSIEAGMNGFQGKPFMIMDLKKLLDQHSDASPDAETSVVPIMPDISPSETNNNLPTPLLDSNALDNIRALQREGAPDILSKIIYLYFETSGDQVQALQVAINDQNATEIGNVAHSLKSSSANLGALKLSMTLKEIERKAWQDELAGLESLMAEVDDLYPQVCQQLRSLC